MQMGSPPKRVLVVDDDEDSAELLAETFQLRGCDVEVAHDGATALRLAEAFLPHVALLDVGLPDMDGYELARRLRGLSGMHQGLRLIALTGFGGPEAERRLREVGFDECLLKPAPPDVLLRAVVDVPTSMLS
jgi:DNA-binding response OmpR family regulator